MQERRKGVSQRVAAARAGMSERTARKYEKARQLPSELKRPHDWATRQNPFEQDWPWVVEQLERDPALQGSTLFALLCERHPERYRSTQMRTLQRHIAKWRAIYGPDKEVIFEQCHKPGEKAESDFTHMDDLRVTIAGQPFPHMIFHLVLTHSNVEAIKLCFSESFEALAEGIEACLWSIGGVPKLHRTDHLSAALRHKTSTEREEWTRRYQALMAHYGMEPTTNNVGVAHENGDVEQSHHRFKQAVDQALRARWTRDFSSRAAYEQFLQDLVHKRNQTRATRFEVEKAALRPLPATPLAPCKELQVSVSRFSTIHVGSNIYSVPSRLIGTTLTVRLRSETIQGYIGTSLVFTFPRLIGKHQHRIDYRHIIWSLVRKPGAFAAYRYRDELFPTTTFRRAYDQLLRDWPKRADAEYIKVLHLAATTSEGEVDAALGLLQEAETTPSFAAVRDLLHLPHASVVPEITQPTLDLSPYDQLIPSRRMIDEHQPYDQSAY
ncbi:MAG TPA: IS21 family transposase [Ktedonobacteraceae bacterium]|nr:IS21 family transposase [Ktedonobacteraceae bacterium]